MRPSGLSKTSDEPLTGFRPIRFDSSGVSVGISSIAELQLDGGFWNRLAITDRRAAPLSGMVTATGDSTELRDWIACLVCSLTEHLAQLGNPTWYARFAAQALTDPAYHKIVIKDALASPSLVQVVDGITRCLPDLPMAVVTERNIMARNLMMHTCADFERAFAEGADVPRTNWSAVGSGLIDAIVGLWLAPVTEHP